MNAVRAQVHGVVQGVGFRYTTQRMARELGVIGWVRNLPGGDVEVWGQGPDEAVERLLAFLERGPRGSVVARVDVEGVRADPTLDGFDVRP